MAERFAGKVALITGGASGIGLASVRRLVAEGAKVAVCDLNAEAGAALVQSLPPGSVRFTACDITDDDHVRRFVASAVTSFGRLDVVFNNAGMLVSGPLTDIAPETWDKVFAVNVKGAFLVCRHAIPALKAGGGGAIINMASLAGLRGMPGLTLYASTKAALIGLSKTLALELAPDRIRVNALCPGWIDTPFNQPVVDALGGSEAVARAVAAGIPLGRMGSAEEVAAMVAYLASDEASFVTGQHMSINGGAYG
jgi:NAD(P)-dependent dehydrogenase (short-subunit alcohol dehydrogenase family)